MAANPHLERHGTIAPKDLENTRLAEYWHDAILTASNIAFSAMSTQLERELHVKTICMRDQPRSSPSERMQTWVDRVGEKYLPEFDMRVYAYRDEKAARDLIQIAMLHDIIRIKIRELACAVRMNRGYLVWVDPVIKLLRVLPDPHDDSTEYFTVSIYLDLEWITEGEP
jgi:hypothetical protein